MIRNGKTIICNQCGSNEIEWTTKDSGVCKYCRSKIIIGKEKENGKQDKNIYRIYDIEKTVINPMFSEKDFLRHVITSFAKDKTVPHDVLSAEFKPVEKIMRQVAVIGVHIDIDYSVTLGFTRNESHYSNNRRYTRKVTDWLPKNGKFKRDFFEYIDISEQKGLNNDDLKRLKCNMQQVPTQYICNIGTGENIQEPSGEAVQSIVETIRQKGIQNCKDSFETEQYKYFKPKEVVKVLCVKSFIVPEYCVEIIYRGAKYIRRAFAIGDISLVGDKIISTDRVFGRREIDSEIERKSKQMIMPYKAISIFLAVCLPLISFLTRNLIVVGCSLIVAAIWTVLYVKLFVPRKKRQAREEMQLKVDNILKQRCRQRLTCAKDLLEKKGLRELSDDEIDGIKKEYLIYG